jgi:hypothetical protein
LVYGILDGLRLKRIRVSVLVSFFVLGKILVLESKSLEDIRLVQEIAGWVVVLIDVAFSIILFIFILLLLLYGHYHILVVGRRRVLALKHISRLVTAYAIVVVPRGARMLISCPFIAHSRSGYCP